MFFFSSFFFLQFLPVLDAEDMHSLHPRTGHHDLLRRPDSKPDPNAQRRLRSAYGPGVCVCRSAAAAGDGRHRDGPAQRHLPHLRRWVRLCRSRLRFATGAPRPCQLIVVSFPWASALCCRPYGPGGAGQSGQAAGAPVGGAEDLHPAQAPKQASHVPAHADESHRPARNQHQR